MKEKLYKQFGVTVKSVNEDEYTIEAVFSTEDEDRHGDIVRQAWDLKQFKKNPVILNSHNYWSATDVIGKAIKIGVKNGQLEGTIKFAVEENPVAKIVFDLYKGNFLSAFSVGFIPKEFSDKGEILKSELLEVSAVSVPANAYALAKSAGINIKPLFKDIMKGLEDDDEIDEDLDDEEEEEGADEGLEAKKEEEVEETEEEAPEAEENEEEEKEPEETEEQKEQARIDAENAIKEEEEKKKREEEEKLEEEVKENVDKMLKLVQATGEKLKAETLREGVRADVARLLNKAVRETVKIKNKL
jgi:flagellar biosynthesis GTPase FlhF